MENATVQRICGLLSALLQYPDEQWRARLPAFREEAESLPDAAGKATLTAFLDQAEAADEWDWQVQYVRTFDFGKQTNLYLTYAQYGEERERGPALLELKRRYAEAGFDLESGELPDYLPLVLEFAAAAPWRAAEGVLAGRGPALRAIRDKLAEADSPYAGLLDALLRVVPDTAPADEPERPLIGGRLH